MRTKPRLALFLTFLGITIASVAGAQICPGKQWDFAPATASGWNADKLSALDDMLKTLHTSALVVVHRGRIVHEDGLVTKPYNLKSGRKSILSMLYGIAAGKGQANLAASLDALGIDDVGGLTDMEKTATVRQLLEARSCIYHVANYETDSMKAKRPTRHSCRPGERWFYNNWDFNALGTAYQVQTGKTVFQGFDEELARPLGMQYFDPAADTEFVGGPASRHPAYIFRLAARDFARLGVLMSRGGNWCGNEIIPGAWVAESTAAKSVTDRPESPAYAYLWWTNPTNALFGTQFPGKVFSAKGHFGQFLLVLPGADLVVAHLTESESRGKLSVSSKDFGRITQAIMEAMPPQAIGRQ